jgi:energy-coupling factor transport system ATP-binding protein
MEIFKINDLSFSYPEKNNLALNNISTKINSGEFITICGKSGCGKSTLLRHLKTCLTPYGKSKGEILFKGKILSQSDKKIQSQQIGYVLQNPDNQIVTDKVWHELAFGLESLGYDKKTIRLRVAEMASFFGIQNWFMKDVSELSGGQKQLLNLASIMAMQPDVIILDEPTAQLDPIAANDFFETIKKINADIGTTIILSEHRLEEVFSISDRVIVIDDGYIIADDTPNKVSEVLIDKNHEMLDSMPSSIRICTKVSKFMLENKPQVYPLTVKEGRLWIENIYDKKENKYKRVDIDEKPSQTNVETAVEIKEVWFRYEKEGDDIVKDLSLKVEKGQFYAIVGGNGTGKTTTLSLISGINRPYRGKVLIDGKDVRKLKNNELFNCNLGVLPQNPQSLFLEMDLERDLNEMLSNFKMNKEEKKAEVDKIAELMEIKDFMKMHPYDLSGGEQQRAALAKVLLLKPKIILLDEPTKAIDSHFKKKLAKILKKLQQDGKTIIMVSHDIEFCAEYADKCSLFFNGNIVTTDNPNSFFSGNSFYTTFANRMTRNIFENAVTVEDVIELCRKNYY